MRKILLIALLVFIPLTLFSQTVKNCEFAGSFYPKDAKELQTLIDKLKSNVKEIEVKGDLVGIISPHAGYVYSGPVAAKSFSLLKDKQFDTIIIMGPSHKYSFEGVSIFGQGKFKTPLGPVEIDKRIADMFSDLWFVQYKEDYFYKEHSLEVQIPFIKVLQPQAKIVPILFSGTTYYHMEKLAQKLANIAKKKNILIVVSTDLSHYHEYDQAVKIDSETIKIIKSQDPTWLWDKLKERRACGILPIITFMMYLNEVGGKIEVVGYANSGDTTGGKRRVVGYMAAYGYKKKEKTMQLNKQEQCTLLQWARASLEEYLKNGNKIKVEPTTEKLKEKRAVFVTLKRYGQLRGCIGRIVADKPLCESVVQVAIDSAVSDPRFSKVTADELDSISIEISVMSPFTKVENLDEIKVGTHGLMIKKGFSSGLLLPQVPTEYGWDKKAYLEQLCRKAGLDYEDYLKDDTEIYKFSAQVFSEEECE